MTLKDRLQNRIAGLQMVGNPALLDRFILRNGVELSGSALPALIKRGIPKHCFMNATNLSNDYGYEYHEGYAIIPRIGMMIHHAWNVRNNVVIDNTWNSPEDCLYIGVPIPIGNLWSEINRLGYYGVLDTMSGLNISYMLLHDPTFADHIKNEFGITLK